MVDNLTTPMPRCPWCSAELPIPGAELCTSCGAALVTAPGADPDIKGVTTLDTEAILRARAEVARPRSRILSFITGEPGTSETGGPASADSLSAPSGEVRREMLRLQLEAERADLQAETVALKSDVLAQRGIHLADLGGALDGHDADAPSSEAPVADDAPEADDAAVADDAAETPQA